MFWILETRIISTFVHFSIIYITIIRIQVLFLISSSSFFFNIWHTLTLTHSLTFFILKKIVLLIIIRNVFVLFWLFFLHWNCSGFPFDCFLWFHKFFFLLKLHQKGWKRFIFFWSKKQTKWKKISIYLMIGWSTKDFLSLNNL